MMGFMGAGKSTALRGARDTDQLLEAELGMPVSQVFAQRGEAAFREAEEALVLRELEAAGPGDTVALGGGSVLSANVQSALRDHTVVWLDVSLDSAWRRAAGPKRPLTQDRDAFARLWSERRPLYERLADVFLPESDRGLPSRAEPFMRGLPAGCKLVWAKTAGGEYPAYVGSDLPTSLAAGPGRAYAVTDRNVVAAQGRLVADAHHTIVIHAGEQHKTLQVTGAVWTELAAQEATRADHVRAVGGGVVGDLAGYCAACYQRGVPVVQVPTTVVAQVDSAYGGKTGVDLPEAKNYVGAYHQPSAVVADVATLATLPPEELAAGYAEVVKTAIIAGGALWDRVSDGAPVDAETILGCARTKLGIVAADERDGGLRQLLNLGHTVGHAIETVTGYTRWRHGEAVSLGLLAALRLSGTDALRAQVRDLLEAGRLPVSMPDIDVDAVVAATRKDKKRVGAETPFVLVRSPGDVVHGQQVPADALRAAVEELAA